MNSRLLVIAAAVVAIAAFGTAAWFYTRPVPLPPVAAVSDLEGGGFVRPYSPVMGPVDAPVTITEFFDPSCEACRAYYPFVKDILAKYPEDVRLVLRYTPFHPASTEAVKILEAARLQDKFQPVLEALLERQGEWGADGSPDAPAAWTVAGDAGLDVAKGQQDALRPGIIGVINGDLADIEKLGVQATPTFFVNGKPLANPSPEQLDALVASEVEALR